MGSQVLKEFSPMHAVHRLNVGGLEGLLSPFGLRYSRTPLKGGLREEFCSTEGELAGAQVILCNANCLRAKYASEQEKIEVNLRKDH
jgi:hypothetical protein